MGFAIDGEDVGSRVEGDRGLRRLRRSEAELCGSSGATAKITYIHDYRYGL
jgi:hypothetical protein